MLARSSLLIFALLFAHLRAKVVVDVVENPLTETEYPKDIKTLKSLKELIKIVDENSLNISLIASSGSNWSNGNLKEVLALTLTFPVNSESLTKTKLTPSILKSLAETATEEKLAVTGTNAVNNQLDVITNFPQGVPINKAYKVFTGIKNGKTGFVFDEENYVAQYTFFSPGADGKNETTKVFYADVDVEVVDQSGLKEKELDIIKKALVDTYFTHESEHVPLVVYKILTKELPKQNWDVAADVGNNHYLDSSSWVQLKIVNEDYLVYAV